MNAPLRPLPAFDPDSDDAEILEAFEFVRTEKVWVYSFDGMPEHLCPTDEMDRRDLLQQQAEQRVEGNFATTLSGVIARLTLALGHEQDRWADRGLAEHGLWALVRRRTELDGSHWAVIDAAWELVHIEWEQALAAYERSAADFDLALRGKGIVERETIRLTKAGETLPDFLKNLEEHFDAAEQRHSNEPEIRRLIRTLTPDHAAYQRKVDIIIAEGVTDDVTPWLARDTALLVGTIPEDSK
jgi:plasmid maintenance system antidote protein VapI